MVSTSRSVFLVVGACAMLAGGVALALAMSQQERNTASQTEAPEATTHLEERSQPRKGLTGIVLKEPVPLGELAPMLEAAGLRPVEFSHERPMSGSADDVSGGFVGRGLPLAEQVAQYRATYRASGAGDDPVVTALVVEGRYDRTALGQLAPAVAQVVRLPDG
jgi:hypothetical protein